MTIRKKRERTATSYTTPMADDPATAPDARTPRCSGEGHSSGTTGRVQAAHTTTSQGVASSMPSRRIHQATSWVNVRPPTERPVEAMASATDRTAVSNQRATTVVAGIRPAALKPTPRTTLTA